MITYRYRPDLDVVHAVYSGVVTVEDLDAFTDRLCADGDLPRPLRLLTDVTGAEYRIHPRQMPRLVDGARRQIETFGLVRAAFVQARPRETALSLLFGQSVPGDRYQHQVFSTEEAALQWLRRPFDETGEAPAPEEGGDDSSATGSRNGTNG